MKSDREYRRATRPAGEVRRRCELFEAECRRRGIRITAQRLAVFRALAEDTTHPTADSVYARLRSGIAGLSLATVYRILESLEQEGFARRVSTTNGARRFDANLAPHQHLVCRRCRRIIDSVVRSFEGLRLPRVGLGDFQAESLDIRIIGTCGRCRRPGGRRAEAK